MNKKGFTLIELLAVLVILSIIMAIAVPNVISTLDRNKKETYVGDAKKLVALAKNQMGNRINKPGYGEIVRINLSCLDNGDLQNDPEGNPYDETDTFVVVVRKDEQLVYYVNLVGRADDGSTRGIFLTEASVFDGDDRLLNVKKGVEAPTDDQIKSTVGVSGSIRVCDS